MTTDEERIRQAPKLVLRNILLGIILAALLVYTGDFCWFHVRVAYPKAGSATGTVHRVRMLAIPNKNGKYDFEMDTVTPEEDLTCVHSLFPHANHNPCWYVTKHANDPIQM